MTDLQYAALTCSIFAVLGLIFQRQFSNYSYEEFQKLNVRWLAFSRTSWRRITFVLTALWLIAAVTFFLFSLLAAS